MIKFIIFCFVLSGGLAFFVQSILKVYRAVKSGKRDKNASDLKHGVLNLINYGLFQKRIFENKFYGVIHFIVFWGFICLLFSLFESICKGLGSDFSFSRFGFVNKIINTVEELFIVLIVIACLSSITKKLFFSESKTRKPGKEVFDSFFVPVIILVIVTSLAVQNSIFIALRNGGQGVNELRPLQSFISSVFFVNSASDLNFGYELFWWIHIVSVLVFLNYLPFSKHLHIFLAAPNLFLAPKAESRYGMIDFNKLPEDNSSGDSLFGATEVTHLKQRQILSGFACTECGRCDSVCPSVISGGELSPKKIVTDIRKSAFAQQSLISSNNEEGSESANSVGPLVAGYITGEELWQCTTCGSCREVCPVLIDQPEAILDMRKGLVLDKGEVPDEFAEVFKNLENYGSPWTFAAGEREIWDSTFKVPKFSEKKDAEFLLWVGCAAVVDERYRKVVKDLAKILSIAGIDYAVLGDEESCSGEMAYSLGNMYLAQTLIEKNISTFKKYNISKIITACPHCFHAFKNLYPNFSGNYEVFHHTEILEKISKEAKYLFFRNKNIIKLTLHDSCYLGKINGNYNSPRNILENIPNVEFEEMTNNKKYGTCCGGGGGGIFRESSSENRINEIRVREGEQTGADTIVTSCPFCLSMLSSGAGKTKDKSLIQIKDVAEIVLENLDYK